MDKRGRYHDFPSKFFGLPVPKDFIGEHFSVSKNFFNRKFSCKGGVHHGFVENFCLTGPQRNSFLKEPFGFSGNVWYRKKFMDKRGHITIFSRNFYVSQCRKVSYGNPTVLEKISSFEKFSMKRGVSHSSVENFFFSQCRKSSWASLQCFRKIGESKSFMHKRGYQDFPSKIFCLTEPKHFVKQPNSVSLISGTKIFWINRKNIWHDRDSNPKPTA